jgi:hypothetical protein
MANINLNLSEEGERKLKRIKAIMLTNGESKLNKSNLIETSIDWCDKIIDSLDYEDFLNVIGKDKRL